MKHFNILLVFLFVSCISFAQKISTSSVGENTFGAGVATTNVLSSEEMAKNYSGLSVNDSIQTAFIGRVKEVCQVKGCWMTLQLNDGEETMVRFKDYAFFMPRDINGKNVIVEGLAFVEEMSVDDQKHYAKDAGASQEEIEKITKPKKTFGFEASGVEIRN